MRNNKRVILVFTAAVGLVGRCSSFSGSTDAKAANGIQVGSSLPVVSAKATPLSKNQRALDEGPRFPRTWVPLASVAELDPDRPTPVYFMDRSYVVYRDSYSNWVVTDDACPHRLAPLSEGRIMTITDSGERLLQCSYHGWSFDSSGKCRDIPQLDGSAKTTAIADSRCNVKSYSTIVEKNIVWTWPWKEDPVELTLKDPTITPEWMLQGIESSVSTFSRDLPYGWDTLIENLIDPAHVPFAHHGLQGTRDDAIPIKMTVPTAMNKSGFDLEFQDRTMKLMRKGEAAFRAPFTITYAAEYDTDSSFMKFFDLTVLCIPTRPGWSRTILLSTSRREDGDKPPLAQLVQKIFGLLPRSLLHIFSNRFFDSDLALLHLQEQERERRGGDADGTSTDLYFVPAQADRAIIAFRRWKGMYASVLSPLPPPIQTRQVLFDRYTQHTEHCVHCRRGLEWVKENTVRTKVVLSLGVLTMATVQNFVFQSGILIVLCIGFLQILKLLEDGFTTGDYNHYKNN